MNISYNHCKLLFIKTNSEAYLSKNNCTFCGRFKPTYRLRYNRQGCYRLCSDAYKNILQFKNIYQSITIINYILITFLCEDIKNVILMLCDNDSPC